LWLHSLKVAQLLRSAACLHTNQSRSYLNHLVPFESELITKSLLWSKTLKKLRKGQIGKKMSEFYRNMRFILADMKRASQEFNLRHATPVTN